MVPISTAPCGNPFFISSLAISSVVVVGSCVSTKFRPSRVCGIRSAGFFDVFFFFLPDFFFDDEDSSAS